MRKHEKKSQVYIGFMDLDRAYDEVNKEALLEVLKMYHVVDELLNEIKSMYFNILYSIRIKGGIVV